MSSSNVTDRDNPLLWIAFTVLVVLAFIALEVFASSEDGLVPGQGRVIAVTMTSTKLFNPTTVRYSGVITTPNDAKVFASINLVLNCPQSPKGTLSSATGGVGDWFVDNFLKLNGKNGLHRSN